MIRKFLRDCTAASAAEFALVLPLLLILLFGIIDAGRFLWTYNRAEKATQMGARMAVVVDAVAGDRASGTGVYASYVGTGGLTQGDRIPPSQLGKIQCTSSGCSCETNPCPGDVTKNDQAFTDIVHRMQAFLPELSEDNVTVEYSSSGLGYAGSPVLPDLSPLVTVKIGEDPATALQFRPITGLLLVPVDMPAFTTTLSAEDLGSRYSN